MNLITKSELATRLDVSRAAITQACKKESMPLTACDQFGNINDNPLSNKYIDLDADTTKQYLENRKKQPQRKPKQRAAETLAPKPKKVIQSDDDDNSNLVLKKELATIEKLKIETELKKLKLAETRGDLIHRSDLGDYLFGVIDAMNRRLLNSPLQFVDSLIAHAEKDGKRSRGKIVELWTGEISKIIQDALNEVEESLK